MSERYEITHISDVLAIPEDKFEEFLVDFRSFYAVSKPMAQLIETIADEVTKVQIKSSIEKMVWIDDGKHDATIKLYNEGATHE